jgi:hypothetical protein
MRFDKIVYLKGAGIGRTILCGTGGTGAGLLEIVGHNKEKSLRISDISFQFLGDMGATIFRIYGDMVNIRIDHCRFENAGRGIWVCGMINGVVDHCDFHNVNICIMPDRDLDQTTWDSPLPLGTDNAVFVEDCTFTGTNPWTTMVAIDGMGGARYVFRYNTVTMNMTPYNIYPFICAHGNQSQTDGSYRGAFSAEVYNNTFYCPYGYYGFYQRGGRGVIFNNKITADTTLDMPICLTDYANFYYINPATGDYWGAVYPTRDQINHYYIWENYLNGRLITDGTNGNPRFVLDRGYDRQNIVNGRDYFDYQMSGYRPYRYPHPLVQ